MTCRLCGVSSHLMGGVNESETRMCGVRIGRMCGVSDSKLEASEN